MYKFKYNFWDDTNFPGFKRAMNSLYVKSIRAAKKNSKGNSALYMRDKYTIDGFMASIEYYYVSILKLGYVTKGNYFNVLNRLKSIKCIKVIDSESLNGLTSEDVIYINPNPDLLFDYNTTEMIKMNSYHELGHIVTYAWDDDMMRFADFIYTFGGVQNRLKAMGLDQRKNIIDGLLLLNEVVAQDVAEDVLSRDLGRERMPFESDRTHTKLFPDLKYESNLCLYPIFQSIAYDFMKCFNFSGMSDSLSKEENARLFNKRLLDRNFINNMFTELYSNPEKVEDYAVMLACLGSVKDAVYSLFGMGNKDNKRIARLAYNVVKEMNKLYKVNGNTNINNYNY